MRARLLNHLRIVGHGSQRTEQQGSLLLIFRRVVGPGRVSKLLEHGRELRAHPRFECRTVASFDQIVVNESQVSGEVVEQDGSRGVLELRAQREIIAHAVLADAHQRPLVADQRDALVGRQRLLDRVAYDRRAALS